MDDRDVILRGDVWTMTQTAQAEAVLIADGVIATVSSADEVHPHESQAPSSVSTASLQG